VAEVTIREAGVEDLEPTYEIVASCQRAVYGEPELTLEHLRNTWDFWRGFTAWEAGRAVGTSAVRGDDLVVFVHPDVRRRGIGTQLLRAGEEAAPLDVLQADAVTLEPAAAPFLRANGYEKVWEIWLMGVDLAEVPVEEPRWPAGIEVRTVRTEDAAAVKGLLDEAYAAEPEHRPVPFDEWRQVMLGDPSFDPDVWLLAESGGELAAAALNWREGYVKDLVVHPAWRRRGLGEALLRRTFASFRERGVARVSLKVLSNNPTQAWRLYERVGMSRERTYEVFQKRVRRPG
jgi:ribosomal protein S18 acetylase RimI-like enzyme